MMDYNTAWSDYNNDNSSNTKHRIFTSQTREKKKKEVTFNLLCTTESFNTNILPAFWLHKNLCQFTAQEHKRFQLKITGIQK